MEPAYRAMRNAPSSGFDSSVTRHSQAVPLLAVSDGIFTRSGGFLSCLSIKRHIHGEIRTHSLLIRSQAPCPLGHADYLNDGGSVCARSYTVRLQKRIKTSSSCRNSRPRPVARRFRFHFCGKQQTNRADRPGWALNWVLSAVRDHTEFLVKVVQPALDAEGAMHHDALEV